MHRIYLDNNATTPVLPEVFEAMRPYFGEHFGNASSIHHHGQETRAAVERRARVGGGIAWLPRSGNCFHQRRHRRRQSGDCGLTGAGDHVITSSIEHHAVLHACKHLEEMGCEVTYLPVDGRGLVDPDDVRRALRPNTKLISIMMANNETGVLQPVEEIGKIAAEADVYFHTDAVQAAGKVPIDVKRDRLRCAFDFRPQDARAAGRGRALRAEGNSPSAAVLWRTPRAFAPRRNGECSRNCGSGQGRGTGKARTRSRRRQEDGRDCATACSREFSRRSRKPA